MSDHGRYHPEPFEIAKPGWTRGEIYTFQEGELWIAAWRQYDIMAQGDSEEKAIRSLYMTIAATALLSASEGQLPFANCPSPSEELLLRWQNAHNRCH